MSTQYQSGKDVPTEVLAARLNELADVVAQKRDRIGAEFTMRVPAECDRDADLVMSEAARRLSAVPAVQGEPVAWSGWGCQYPGKMPRLYGERRIAELNCDWENGDQVLHFTAAPQPVEQQCTPHPDEDYTPEERGRPDLEPALGVAGLVEALEAFVRLSQDRDRELGCLSQEMNECLMNGVIALAPYRKGGDA